MGRKNPKHQSSGQIPVGKTLKEKVFAISADAEAARLRAELAALKKRYSVALDQVSRGRAALDSMASLSGLKGRRITRAKRKKSGSSATAVLVLSDWHVEEEVRPELCRDLNEFTLEIAERRISQLAKKAAMLIEHETALTNVRRICICALGDFITGHIHDDLVETTQLSPLAALRWAGQRLDSVIGTMADIAPVLVATATGNHGRTTMKPRISTENEHSFEQHLYLTMKGQERRKNVSWQIGEGYLNVVNLDGFRLRAHHGHAIRFAGGIGGLTIPMNKAIANWNQAEKADLDVLGHWHTFSWLPYRFVSNGSLIGHNPFADRIKAEYQPPSQSLIVVDHDHNRVTKVLPIFLSRSGL